MKKLVVNGKFLLHKITGVERYAIEILSELDNLIDGEDIELLVPKNIKNIPKYNKIKIKKFGIFTGLFWEQISLPLYLIKENAKCLNLCNSSPLFKPDIVCIHDMKIKVHPEFFNLKFLIWYRIIFYNAIKRASNILTVSNFSKKEIISYYDVKKEKINIIYNSWQHYDRIEFDKSVLNKFNLVRFNYFFSLSSIEKNKNLKWILKVANNNPNEVFIVAGKINDKIFTSSINYVVPKNVKFIGYVSDVEGKTLMKFCKAFLFVTLYEGFGIPPLEALSAGAKSIVVSDIEIMHEIFEEGINYINPYDYNIDLLKIINISNIQRNHILNKFSWNISAHKLKKIIDKNIL